MSPKSIAAFEKYIGRSLTLEELERLDRDIILYGQAAMYQDGEICELEDIIIVKLKNKVDSKKETNQD